MRLILVRHYRTVNNQDRLIIGWGDSPPSSEWEADLLDVKDRIESNGLCFDTIWSSDLVRARDTALYYADKLGCRVVRATPQLNEVNYGDLYQCQKQWVVDHYPQYKTDADFVFPGGESFRQMQRRSVDFVLSLQRRQKRDTLMLVAHAGVIRGLVCHFLGLDFASNLKRKVSHRYIGDFSLEGDRCLAYRELGKPSGFVRDNVVEIPWYPVQLASGVTNKEGVTGYEESGQSYPPFAPSF